MNTQDFIASRLATLATELHELAELAASLNTDTEPKVEVNETDKVTGIEFYSESDPTVRARGNMSHYKVANACDLKLPRAGKIRDYILSIAATGKKGITFEELVAKVYHTRGKFDNAESLKVYASWDCYPTGFRIGQLKGSNRFVIVAREGQTQEMLNKALAL